jgi:hypothetical protein
MGDIKRIAPLFITISTLQKKSITYALNKLCQGVG